MNIGTEIRALVQQTPRMAGQDQAKVVRLLGAVMGRGYRGTLLETRGGRAVLPPDIDAALRQIEAGEARREQPDQPRPDLRQRVSERLFGEAFLGGKGY